MQFIETFIGTPLGYVMYLCYNLVLNYGIAIIVFTLTTKIILMPVSINVQKNSIKMVKMQSKIDNLKRKYPSKQDKEQFMDEQVKLFDEEKYSPAAGILPLFIQIPIVVGLIDVINKPLKHLLHISTAEIDILSQKTMEILSLKETGSSIQLRVVETLNNPQYTGMFDGLVSRDTINRIGGFHTSFFGLNLSSIPNLSSILVMIPLLAGLAALLLCVYQNIASVLQSEQGNINKWGLSIFMTLFSVYFAFIVPVGVGIYWIFSNMFAILQLYILNKIYDPKEYIDYEYVAESKHLNKIIKEEKARQKIISKENKPREKADYKKFFSNQEKKKLVFYSERSGFYKYFENLIDEIIGNSDVSIHYITSDPYDAVFNKNEPRIIPYYIGERKLITLMMKMEADVVVMTMPDLDNFHIKRSYVDKDVEYIYMCHGLTSTNMCVREGAYDNFDTIFCVGKHQVDEIRETEKIYDLKPKNLIEYGYGLLENMIDNYGEMDEVNEGKKRILIAPSYQDGNILDICIDDILSQLLLQDYKVVVRPHPQFIKLHPYKVEELIEKYKDKLGKDFSVETDFSSNETVFSSDILITDWSGIAHEFSYTTKKPSLFINTKMKVVNPEYVEYKNIPLDITLRDKIGKSIDLDEIDSVMMNLHDLLENSDEYKDIISDIVSKYVFNLGNSSKIGTSYILEKIKMRED